MLFRKPTYQALDWEKKYKESREAVARLAKHVKVKGSILGSEMISLSGS